VSKIGSAGKWLLNVEDILSMVANSGAVTKNRKNINGMNGMVLEDWNGRQYIAQISGYNGNSGMYCYLVQPDDSLEMAV
jgi:hypothetical protein